MFTSSVLWSPPGRIGDGCARSIRAPVEDFGGPCSCVSRPACDGRTRFSHVRGNPYVVGWTLHDRQRCCATPLMNTFWVMNSLNLLMNYLLDRVGHTCGVIALGRCDACVCLHIARKARFALQCFDRTENQRVGRTLFAHDRWRDDRGGWRCLTSGPQHSKGVSS